MSIKHWVYSFIHSHTSINLFIQQIFIENLLYASCYAGAVITPVNKMNNVHTLRELMLVGTESLASLLQGIPGLASILFG